MPTFTLHEPHPHTPVHATPFGRGGAGNLTRSSRPTNLPAPPTSLSSSSAAAAAAAYQTQNNHALAHSLQQNKPFHVGRGGAGNFSGQEDERRLFSFDEELEREDRRDGGKRRVPVYHIGRGGSGNAVAAAAAGSGADGDSRRNSSSSSGSEGSKKLGNLLKGLSKRVA